MRKIYLYIFLFIGLPAFGQDYQISLRKWEMKDGLNDRQINAMMMDRHGFLWAGTKNGLNCFDGYQFKVYEKGKNHIPFSYIAEITDDYNGDLWVLGSARFDNNDLFIFDPLSKTATSFKEKTGYKEDQRFNFLQKLNDSTLFFGNTANGYFFIWTPVIGLKKYSTLPQWRCWLPLPLTTRFGYKTKRAIFAKLT